MAQVTTVPIEVEDAQSEVNSRIKNITEDQRSSFSGTTEPASPVIGHLWMDTSVTPNILKVYDGNNWLAIAVSGITTITDIATTPYTVLADDEVIRVDATAAGGNVTLNFPTAASIDGKPYIVILETTSASRTCILDPFSFETVGQNASMSLKAQGHSVVIKSNGTNWDILGAYGFYDVPIHVDDIRNTAGTPIINISSGSVVLGPGVELHTDTIDDEDANPKFDLSQAGIVALASGEDFVVPAGGEVHTDTIDDEAGAAKIDLSGAGKVELAAGEDLVLSETGEVHADTIDDFLGQAKFDLSTDGEIKVAAGEDLIVPADGRLAGDAITDSDLNAKINLATAGIVDIQGGTVLRSQPAGGAGEFVRHGGSVNTDHANVTANSGSSETTALSLSIDGNTLFTDGDYLEIDAWGTSGATVNAPVIKLKFGATTILTATMDNTASNVWRLRAKILRLGATTQATITTFEDNARAAVKMEEGSPGETLSGAVTLVLTMQNGDATANAIFYRASTLKWFPAASV